MKRCVGREESWSGVMWWILGLELVLSEGQGRLRANCCFHADFTWVWWGLEREVRFIVSLGGCWACDAIHAVFGSDNKGVLWSVGFWQDALSAQVARLAWSSWILDVALNLFSNLLIWRHHNSDFPSFWARSKTIRGHDSPKTLDLEHSSPKI